MSVTPLQALVFDVDGTLADTEHRPRFAFNEVFSRAGLPWHWDALTDRRLLAVPGGKERIAHWRRQHRAEGKAPRQADDEPVLRLHVAKASLHTSLVDRGGDRHDPATHARLRPPHRPAVRAHPRELPARSWMPRGNTIGVPGDRMALAMRLIFTPFVRRMTERRDRVRDGR